MALLKKLED
jgi:ABC-type multidrug transport system fused ATPase/permease subunit